MLPPSWHLFGVLLVLTATTGDFTDKIILPQVVNGSVGGGTSSLRKNSKNNNNKNNNYNNAHPTTSSKSSAPAIVSGASPNSNTVLSSTGVIVAGGVSNAPTPNLNSKYACHNKFSPHT